MTRPEERTAAPETIEMIGGCPVHPAANLLPAPTEEEYKRLKADIKEHGLRVPIVITRDGQIIDGRTRARICDELRIDYTAFLIHRPASYDEMEDPVGFVLSMNAARRHLTGDQVIALYLKAEKAKIEADTQAAKVAQRAGLKKGSTKPVSTTMKPTGKTAAKIAKAVGKSKSAVERVLKVQKDAPEKMADVAAGKVSASKVLEEITLTQPAIKVLKESRATKSDEHGVSYRDSLGRRRPKRPLQDRMKYPLNSSLPEAIGLLGQLLLEARQRGHQGLPGWIQQATAHHTMLGAVIELAKREPCPTAEDLEALLDPDQEGDEAAGDPSATVAP